MSYDSTKVTTAWRGHERFVWWLVQMMYPKLTVELGVDEGFSLIELARYNKGRVVGVDHFQGDAHTGPKSVMGVARQNIDSSGVEATLVPHTFEKALCAFHDETIDILHIDGAHDYDSVRRDFEMYYPKVRKGGVILMHDIYSYPNDVGRLFHSLEQPHFDFDHAHGLGVVLKP